MMRWGGLFLCSYLIGAIPTAYLAGKHMKGVDIRRLGSGNVGATNAFRVLGRKAGIFVFTVDLLKGLLPVVLFTRYFGPSAPTELFSLWIGIGAILGHIFTPFLSFKGGKGVATGAGALCGAFPMLFLWAALVWITTFRLWRTVSISSLAAMFSFVIFALIFNYESSVVLVLLGLCLIVTWTHRSNLARLMNGKENSFKS